MKKFSQVLFVGYLALMMALPAVAAQDEINIVGSTTVLPIAQLTAEQFMEDNLDIDISVGGGGSSVGAKALLSGTCDIADCSRPLKDKEMVEAASKGIDPKPHIVAMDGIAVIVHKSNPIGSLSLDDIKAIYTGEMSYWSEVNGGSEKIVVISRDTSSGTYEAFNELALEKAKVRADALLQASNKAVLTTVARTPGAIGYIGMGYLSNDVKALKVDGIVPTKETVLSKEYPISRPLYMYTNGVPKGSVKKYLDFVKSKEGQALAEQEGFVGLQ